MLNRNELQDLGYEWVLETTFLASLGSKLQDDTLAAMDIREYAAGETLITKGKAPRGVDLVVEGELHVFQDARNTQPLARLTHGQVVGERSLLLKTRTGAHVVAVAGAITLHLPASEFTRLLRNDAVQERINSLVRLRDEMEAFRPALLDANDYLRALTEGELLRLLQAGTIHEVAPREAIIQSGERDEAVFVVMQGSVAVYAPRAEGGDRTLLVRKHRGWMFGHAAPVMNRARTADVEALEGCRVLRIPGATLMAIAARNQNFFRRLLLDLADTSLPETVQATHRGRLVVVVDIGRQLAKGTVAYALAHELAREHDVVLLDHELERTAALLGCRIESVRVAGRPLHSMGLDAPFPIYGPDQASLPEAADLLERLECHTTVVSLRHATGGAALAAENALIRRADHVVYVRHADTRIQHQSQLGQRTDVVRVDHNVPLPLKITPRHVRLQPGDTGPREFRTTRRTEALVDPAHGFGRAMQRLGRAIQGRTVGLALGGGGALGFAHIGLIRALEENDIPVDLVAGASFGALVAGIYCSGGLAALERLVDERRVISAAAVGSLFTTRSFKWLAERFAGSVPISTTEIPFYPVAVNLLDGTEHVRAIGTVGDGVRTSSGLPGAYPSERRGRLCLVDGGISNNVPTSVVLQGHADFVVASNIIPSFPFAKTRGVSCLPIIRRADEVVRSLYMLMGQTGRDRSSLADHFFDLKLTDFAIFDFSKGDRIADAGYAQAIEEMSAIKYALERATGAPNPSTKP